MNTDEREILEAEHALANSYLTREEIECADAELEARIAALEGECRIQRDTHRKNIALVRGSKAALVARVAELEAEVERQRATVIGLLGAEWMVTHDWGGDRESILRAARIEIGHDPDGGDDSGALAALQPALPKETPE